MQSLAKKYGIATPYTSYLIVPDGVDAGGEQSPGRAAAAQGPARPGGAARPWPRPTAGKEASNVADFAKKLDEQKGMAPGQGGGLGAARNGFEDAKAAADAGGRGRQGRRRSRTLRKAKRKAARPATRPARRRTTQLPCRPKARRRLSCQTNNLRNQSRLEQTRQKRVDQQPQLPGGRRRLDRRRLQLQDADPGRSRP